MNQSEKRNTRIFRLAALLLLGVLLTTRMLGGIPARFSSNATGQDSAGIALYVVAAKQTSDAGTETMQFQKGTSASKSYSFKVTNYIDETKPCEVAMTYSIRFTVPDSPWGNNNPLTVTKVTRGGTDITSQVKPQADATTWIYKVTDNSNTFAAGVASESPVYTVTVSYTSDVIGTFTYIDVNTEALSSSTNPSDNVVSIPNTAIYTASVKIDIISEQVD